MSKPEKKQLLIFAIFLILLLLALAAFNIIHSWTIDKIATGVGYQFSVLEYHKNFRTELVGFLRKSSNLELGEEFESYLIFESNDATLTVSSDSKSNFTVFVTTKNEKSKNWLSLTRELGDFLIVKGVDILRVTLQRNPSTYDCGDINKPCDQDITDCFKLMGVDNCLRINGIKGSATVLK